MKHYQVITIGAGAAGLVCALTAGQRGRKVLILDHSDAVGSKILVSGGGHCNFTNLWVQSEHYLSNNPKFSKSALSRFTPDSFISLLEKYNIAYHEKKSGQLFCDNKSKEILSLLLKECEIGKVEIKTNCKIGKITKNQLFTLTTNSGDYTAESLVIATGGLSMSEMGASGFGYDIAKQFELNVNPTYPALVPFTLNNKKSIDLAGISVDALVSCNGQSFRESILFTHKGLSGPAILQISNYWNKGDEIVINLLPDLNLAVLIEKWQKERPKAELKNLMSELLPKRIVLTFLKLNKPINQYNQKEITQIAETFHKWRITPSGTEGYKIAEVTKGGVDTKEISSKTFESHKVNGLYFIGEVLDVTGELGGFNLHWAWASGYAAGQFV
ncbi:MAG: NAD(P)/FAD-dependent oxidoreductase [Candidatus Omnitrophica bacterium]|nr:NAD(P)/FAD-dependent oxidoreductase [Candidatus Omnitrophota bacterium]MBU1047119.1 NAD(P)/FAD-dependent oxidoreductase [Candidatus Omnitrophota bacterium]MBU1767688.1 NAD(P)/FAD-dependent oxidoreductase [Candidatus Omnitrophota bacterium]MBU1889603.1 NAD(P)/FAD-dependent oxidoreductase [Candidatus Omnitrophota bacterium]